MWFCAKIPFMTEGAISDEELEKLLSGGEFADDLLDDSMPFDDTPPTPIAKAPERTLSQAEIDAMLAALSNQ